MEISSVVEDVSIFQLGLSLDEAHKVIVSWCIVSQKGWIHIHEGIFFRLFLVELNFVALAIGVLHVFFKRDVGRNICVIVPV